MESAQSSFTLLSPQDAKQLAALCRAGKLHDVENWIKAGKSIHSRQRLDDPLDISVRQGFHSLAELLLSQEISQEMKNSAFMTAAANGRADLVELLVDHGAEVRSVEMTHVLVDGDPAVCQFLLDHGADVVTDAPFAVAFRQRVRTVLRLYIDHKKAHPEIAADLQEQADRALRHFTQHRNLEWVTYLLAVGADPRSHGPTLDERFEDSRDMDTSALRAACGGANVEILKKFHPNAKQDDLGQLVEWASDFDSPETIQYLLQLGASPNDKPNGGSSALDRCFRNLPYACIPPFGKEYMVPLVAAQGLLIRMRELAAAGAQWKLDHTSDMVTFRRYLYRCDPDVTVEVVKLLREHKACPEATVRQFLDSARMQAHLGQLGKNLYPSVIVDGRNKDRRRSNAAASSSRKSA